MGRIKSGYLSKNYASLRKGLLCSVHHFFYILGKIITDYTEMAKDLINKAQLDQEAKGRIEKMIKKSEEIFTKNSLTSYYEEHIKVS